MMSRIRQQMAKEGKGFTLIELLVVMIIIGILAAIAIPIFMNQRKKAEDSAAKADVSTLGKEIATYYVDNTSAITVTGGNGADWELNGESIGNSSKNVVLDGSTSVTNSETWCVAVKNAKGDKAVAGFAYSAQNGLQEGTCTAAPVTP